MCTQIGLASRTIARIAIALLVVASSLALAPTARAADAITVTVHLHSCPRDFDGTNGTISAFATACRTGMSGVTFALQYGNLAPARQTDASGSVTFSDVPPGKVTLYEVLPDPSLHIRAFCSQFDANTPPSNYVEAPAGQGSASWNLKAGQGLDCEWYNFAVVVATATPTRIPLPTATPTSKPTTIPTATATATRSASSGNSGGTAVPGTTNIAIEVYLCPDGYDPMKQDADPESDCTQPVAGQDFTSLGANSGKLATRTSDKNGAFTFNRLGTGDHLISELNFDQYATAFIGSCRSDRYDLSHHPLTPFAFVSPAGSIWINVEKGETLTCTWFDIPAK